MDPIQALSSALVGMHGILAGQQQSTHRRGRPAGRPATVTSPGPTRSACMLQLTSLPPPLQRIRLMQALTGQEYCDKHFFLNV